jgi:hypothetical protein
MASKRGSYQEVHGGKFKYEGGKMIRQLDSDTIKRINGEQVEKGLEALGWGIAVAAILLFAWVIIVNMWMTI